MIEILKMEDKGTVGLSFEGKIEASDLERIFNEVKEAANENDKIKLYVEARDCKLSDMSADALKEDLNMLFRNLGLLPKIEKTALVTDESWMKSAFGIESALIPTMSGESFSINEKEEAVEWLRTDQRAASRLNLTVSELAEIATLKAAGGFALGLLTASALSERWRKNIGLAVLLGGIAVGVPLGIKVLNNNRNLLSA